ncbi:hypothetical protein CFC21_047933 [Triticum aestivum]|uniref:3-hydroxyisobutyrate dehydrogenase-like 1, mitochondrial n=3 Tax=Triticinae TaxID=1648030 RepID=A0A9R1G0E7_WHEAT|nr:probable 3-hydroxyisobutyrate dehydrogenase-like 1, mitochondrial [Aegilops tauschii subsp. strangulata]XP_044357669.1 probable 3-hydroxyisobutyrate dehydrogenase-like 1, mitochondrial [Triticum aestivum]KAF7037592.1 hypothetical protein CFC21_047933 [Triticum aestivum]
MLASISRSLARRRPRLPLATAAATAAMSSSDTAGSVSDRPISPDTTRIGWVGTGVMGQSMAGHLLAAGYALTVYNRTPSKAQGLVSSGARLVDSPRAAAAAADVIFLMVGFPSDVRSTSLDPSTGALAGLAPGGVLVDMTTSDPTLAAEIAAAAAGAGCAAVDAPVSGGDRGARNACLSIFAGGDAAVVARLAPLFKLMGNALYMGGPGAGQRAKLGNQIAIASTMVGLVEGMVYAHKAGLDVGKWLEAISTGAAGSKSLELYGKRMLERDMAAGFYVRHFVKDLGICLSECQTMGLALPGLALAHQLYVSLLAHGEGGLGTQALILAVERLNNTCLDKKGE